MQARQAKAFIMKEYLRINEISNLVPKCLPFSRQCFRAQYICKQIRKFCDAILFLFYIMSKPSMEILLILRFSNFRAVKKDFVCLEWFKI